MNISCQFGIVALLVKSNDTVKTYFTETDNLGSIVGLINENGSYAEMASFDPWGNRRGLNWLSGNAPEPVITDRGFTGHEHLDKFGLINMNGRVYDPILARFLGVDPIVGDITSSQAFNGYSYCFNNPLKYTDPSGYYVQLRWGWNNKADFPEDLDGLSPLAGRESWATPGTSLHAWYSNPQLQYQYSSYSEYDRKVNTVTLEVRTYSKNPTVKYSTIEIDGIESLFVEYGDDGGSITLIDIILPSGDGDGHSFTDYLSFGFGAGNFYYSGIGSALHNELYWVQLNGTPRLTSNIGNNYLLQRSYRITGELAESAKIAARSFAYASTAISGYNMITDFRFANTFDFAMGLTTFLPGVGWAISGLYFISNVAVESYTGKTIGEHLEMQINKIGQ